MKISVSSYSFSKLFKDGGLNQLACISKAKEMGFDAIEFSGIIPHDGSDKFEYAKKLAEESKRVGLPISDLVDHTDFVNMDFAEAVARGKEIVDLGEILGVSVIRHDAADGNKNTSFGQALPIIAKGCREVTEYAEKKGIKTTVENHGYFCQDAYRMEQLFDAVNHPNFGLLGDMGNFLCADNDPKMAFSMLAPRFSMIHAKDFHYKSGMEPDPGEGFFKSRGQNYLRGAIIGQGNVPVYQCLKIAKAAGYDGYVSIEFEGIEDPILGISIGLANLRKYIEAL